MFVSPLRSLAAVAPAAALLAVLVTFLPALDHGFLEWDDRRALVDNAALDAPHAVRWAFSTHHMNHYQPLSWLAWALGRRLCGGGPWVHHLLSLLVHLVNTALVWWLALRLGRHPQLGWRESQASALLAALLFALHPQRVEAVAWASALPYPLALAPLLLALLAYLGYLQNQRSVWLVAALGAFVASLLARAVGAGFPALLFGFDLALRRPWRRALLEKLPFVMVAALAAWAEGSARQFVALTQVGAGARLVDAGMAPLVYLGRALWPVNLTPLAPLPRATGWTLTLSGLALALGIVACVRLWRHRPAFALAAVAYLVMLGPALGLSPSGLRVLGDRYGYAPGVALALTAAACLGALLERRRLAMLGSSVVLVLALAAGTWRQLPIWRDSLTLWSRTLEHDPGNRLAARYLLSAIERDGGRADARAVAALRRAAAADPGNAALQAALERAGGR